MTPVQELQTQCRLFQTTMTERQNEVRKDRRRTIAGVVILSTLLIVAVTFKVLLGG